MDELGLDRKTGRILTPTPEQIWVGGEGPQKLSISYIPLNPGRPGSQDYASLVRLDMAQSGTAEVRRSTGTNGSVSYEYYTIQYPEGSSTFRRNVNAGSGFEAEYPNGGTLILTPGGVLFTDKNGITVEKKSSPVEQIIQTYPDGRQIFYTNIQNYTSPNYGPVRSISNNFGFGLKYQMSSDGMRIFAINRAVDICDPSAPTCSTFTKQRYSITKEISNNVWTFVDAGGGVTNYRSVPIEAKTEKAYCYFSGTVICNSPFLVTRYYPAGVKFPSDIGESFIVSYSNPDSHDEIGVSSIIRNGTTIGYSQQRLPYGAPGFDNNPNVLPYKLTIRSSVGGVQLSFSQSDRGFSGWGGGRMALNFFDDAFGNRTTYDFNLLYEVSGVRLPEGNGQRFEYDARWNVTAVYDVPKSGTGVAELVMRFVYPATCSPGSQAVCNKPVAIIDKRGNQTDFTYNSMGQVLTEMGPANSGGLRPTTYYQYTLRTAYLKNSSGNPAAAGLPISLLTRKIDCRTQQNCIGISDAVVTEYDYGPTTGLNNLLLRGLAVSADEQIRRTCYKHNYFGDVISTTQPRAMLASCS